MLEATAWLQYSVSMDTVPLPHTAADIEAEQSQQLAWEASCVAEARASLAAGFYVDADDVDAWIDSIGTENELPPPQTRHR